MELRQVNENTYEVLSDSGNIYKLKVNPVGISCTCLGYKHRHACKHIKLLDIPEKKKYPRDCVIEVLNGLHPAICNTQYTVAGSYRRQKDMISDVDILIVCDEKTFLEVQYTLSGLEYVTIKVAGSEIIRGVIPASYGDIQFDITRVNEVEYPFYLLYRTGPKDLNIRMRSLAKMLDLKLNEHGLYRQDGSRTHCETEADIFTELNMKYLTPAER